MKKSYRFMVRAFTVVYMLFLCSCIQIKQVGEDAQSGPADAGTVSESIDLSGLDDVEVVMDGTSAPPPEPSESVLGSVSFTPDTARTAKGEYLPGEDGLTLEVTDAQGIKWSLEIPTGAVPSVETVSMTALGGIKGDVLTEVKSGVLLEPDGLQFVRAARLTASGPGIDDMVLLMADHGGGLLTYEPGVRSDGKITIGLMHFSSSFAGGEDDPAMDGMKSEMTKALKDLREQHDFKAVHAILRVGREAELLGGKGRDYISEIEKAMRMMVRFDTTVTVQGADVVYDLKGEAEVPYVYMASYQTGTGTGRFTGFKSPVDDLQLVLSGFDVTVFIEDFNPCKAEEIKVYIDRFGPESETYSAKGYSAPAGTGLANSSGKWAFSDRAAQDVSEAVGSSAMLFRFELPFTNGSQIMAEQEYNVPISQATFRYHLVLEHKPQ